MHTAMDHFQPSLSVFSYRNAVQFLLDTLGARQKLDSKFSARAWAKEMELSSPSLLIMILQGSRPLRLKHAEFLNRAMNLSTPEQLFFRGLIQLANASSSEEKQLCEFWLAELNPGATSTVKEINDYEIISKWIHFTIMAMTKLKSFDGRAETVYAALKSKTTIHEVRSALMRLEQAGFLKKNEYSGRIECQSLATSTRDDVAVRASKEYFQQVFELAKQAAATQSIHEREFQALAVAIPLDRMPLAKEMIRRFRAQFVQAMVPEDASADTVYQLNLQFFRLTESPPEQWCLSENEGAAIAQGKTLQPKVGHS